MPDVFSLFLDFIEFRHSRSVVQARHLFLYLFEISIAETYSAALHTTHGPDERASWEKVEPRTVAVSPLIDLWRQEERTRLGRVVAVMTVSVTADQIAECAPAQSFGRKMIAPGHAHDADRGRKDLKMPFEVAVCSAAPGEPLRWHARSITSAALRERMVGH